MASLRQLYCLESALHRLPRPAVLSFSRAWLPRVRNREFFRAASALPAAPEEFEVVDSLGKRRRRQLIMQMEHPEAMTWRLEDGDRAGLSFIQPKNLDEVHKRSLMFRRWAEYSGGMLGRTPDYLNASIAAMAAASKFFSASDPRFGDNIQAYYREARKHDWCATHTLVNPKASRAAGWAGHSDADLALQLVERTKDGIIV